MSQILFIDGQIVFKNGQIVFVDDPADCDCCGPLDPCTDCAITQTSTVTVDYSSLDSGCFATYLAHFRDTYDRPQTYVTQWTWYNNADEAFSQGPLEIKCVDGLVYARLKSRLSTIYFGDPATGDKFKDVTAFVTCNGSGQISGTFTLEITGFCSGGTDFITLIIP